MKSPPLGVKLVMRAICIMLGIVPAVVAAGKIKDEDVLIKAWWDESIRVLGSFHFLDSLMTYDKDSMTPEMAAQVRLFVTDPAFDPMVVARSSKSAAVLAKWVLAMDEYQKVKKVVDPKREALRVAEGELAAQELRLTEARQRLAAINAKINVSACIIDKRGVHACPADPCAERVPISFVGGPYTCCGRVSAAGPCQYLN